MSCEDGKEGGMGFPTRLESVNWIKYFYGQEMSKENVLKWLRLLLISIEKNVAYCNLKQKSDN